MDTGGSWVCSNCGGPDGKSILLSKREATEEIIPIELDMQSRVNRSRELGILRLWSNHWRVFRDNIPKISQLYQAGTPFTHHYGFTGPMIKADKTWWARQTSRRRKVNLTLLQLHADSTGLISFKLISVILALSLSGCNWICGIIIFDKWTKLRIKINFYLKFFRN